jgi:hypothetical protein
MSLGGNALAAAAANGQAAPPAQTPPPPPPAQTQEPTSAKDAIAQGIAGHFGLGGFGKKKKKTEDAPAAEPTQSPAASGTTASPAPAATPGSLMEMTIEVTSYSADPLDKSLFDVPLGYAQVQPDLEKKTARP